MRLIFAFEELERRELLTGWHNATLPLDVNDSGLVTALDALLVINELNSRGAGILPPSQPPGQEPRYVDVNNNARLTAMDALLVINGLNQLQVPITIVLSATPEHDPNGNGVVLRESVTLQGQTIPEARVRIRTSAINLNLHEVEDQEILIDTVADATGRFTTNQSLFWGLNRISLTATDKLGRQSAISREITRADFVTDWNAAILNVIRDWTGLSNDPYPGRIVPSKPPVVARDLALIHTAMFEAMNAVSQQYTGYLNESYSVQPGTSAESAGISAAYEVAMALHPENRERSVWEATRSETLAVIPDGPSKQNGIQLGRTVAQRILADRHNDGSAADEIYASSGQIGGWNRTAPDFLPPLVPHWGQVRPLAVGNIQDYRPGPPPALSSAEYAASVDEVMRIGRIDSQERTAEQTEIAIFWIDGGGTATPPGHWNRIASRISLAEQQTSLERARMFSLLNLAAADAGVASWDAKYHYDFWRPIEAIRRADEDGNPATVADPSWLPLVRTPPFPAYTSGHSSFSGSAATVLAHIFGEDYSFASRSDGHTGLTQKPLKEVITRQFTSFWQAAEEASRSRIYGGIHYDFDGTEGLSSGAAIGEEVVGYYFLPID